MGKGQSVMRQGNKNSPHITVYSSQNNGFTLLELIIVLFLIMLILSISTVFFANTMPSNRLNATVREMSAAIKHARSLTQIAGEKQTITIDLDSKNYGIEGRMSKSIPSDIYIKVIDPFSGEKLNGKYLIVFHTTGNIEGGEIVLWNNKRAVSIRMDPVVGSVVIK